MKKLAKLVLAAMIAVVVVAIGQLSHVSAMQDQTNMLVDESMVVMDINNQHRSMSCMESVLKNEDVFRSTRKVIKNDKQPQPPFYTQFFVADINRTSVQLERYIAHYAHSKIPIYKMCSVVRR